jgi:hypothetical protein
MAGDLLNAGPASEAIVMQCGDVRRLSADTAPIRVRACAETSTPRLAQLVAALYPKFVTDKDVSGGRGDNQPVDGVGILFPANDSAVLTPAPSFAWEGPGGPYEIAVYDDQWSVLWMVDAATSTRIEYPKNRRPLVAGSSYRWEVRSKSSASSVTARFDVLSGSARAALQKDIGDLEADLGRAGSAPAVRFLALAGLLRERNLQAEAVATLERGLRATPDSKELALALEGLVSQRR